MKTIQLIYWFCLCGPTLAWFVNNNPAAKIPAAAVPENVKLLILPGFGNDSSDYFLEQAPQGSLVESLRKRGWKDVTVLPLKRIDWLQVFTNGIFDIQFWQNCAPPTRSAFAWYLNRVADCVHDLTAAATDDRVMLICHSAGGWLARAALGWYGEEEEEDANSRGFERSIDLSKICGVVTLGAPHDPPPPHVMDMTRGALRLTSEAFPGAYHEGIFYITVVGDAVQGIKQERKSPFEPTSATGFAYSSYEAVCGNGETVGDGVVPKMAAHLEGAVQLDLEGIYHSINVPNQWYGSDSVLDLWHAEMLRQIQRTSSKSGVFSTNPLESIFKR